MKIKNKDKIKEISLFLRDLDGSIWTAIRAGLAPDAFVVFFYHDLLRIACRIGVTFLRAHVAACSIPVALAEVYSDFIGHFDSRLG